MKRMEFINGLLGKPYKLGCAGPDAFDCYGLARFVQKELFGLDLPPFEAPSESGRTAIAAFLTAHPERKRWVRVDRPVDGALVSMAKQDIGYHLGVYLADDGGLILHSINGQGVVADRPFVLDTLGWRRIQYLVKQ